jgi:hypothetical protein
MELPFLSASKLLSLLTLQICRMIEHQVVDSERPVSVHYVTQYKYHKVLRRKYRSFLDIRIVACVNGRIHWQVYIFSQTANRCISRLL